jgi:hypothetical protein
VTQAYGYPQTLAGGRFGIADFVADMMDYIIGQGFHVGEFMKEAERIGAQIEMSHGVD